MYLYFGSLEGEELEEITKNTYMMPSRQSSKTVLVTGANGYSAVSPFNLLSPSSIPERFAKKISQAFLIRSSNHR